MARGSKSAGGRGGKGGAGGGASSGAVRAGGAFVELFTKDTQLQKGLKAASEKLKAWSAAMVKAGAASVAGASLAIGAAITHFVSRGDSIQKASTRLGISADVISALGYAAEQSGSDLAGLETGIKKLQKVVEDANGGGIEAAETFAVLGLEAGKLRDMKPDEMWLAVADSLSQVENATARNALAMKAFGKSGVELVPLLAGGAKGVRALMGEAGRVGRIITPEQAMAAEKIGDAFERVWASLKGVAFTAGAALAPAANDIEKVSLLTVDVVKRFGDWVQSAEALGGAFAGIRKEWDEFFTAYEQADMAGQFELQTAVMDLAWAKLIKSMEGRLESWRTTVAKNLNAGAFAFSDIATAAVNKVTQDVTDVLEAVGAVKPGTGKAMQGLLAPDRGNLANDFIQNDLQLNEMQNEAIAELQRKVDDAKANLQRIVRGDGGDRGGFDFDIKNALKAAQNGLGTSTKGSFNPGVASQFYGGGGALGDLKKLTEEQNGLMKELIAAMRNVPLARL